MLVDKILGFLDNVLQLGGESVLCLCVLGYSCPVYTCRAVVSVLLLEIRKFATMEERKQVGGVLCCIRRNDRNALLSV